MKCVVCQLVPRVRCRKTTFPNTRPAAGDPLHHRAAVAEEEAVEEDELPRRERGRVPGCDPGTVGVR